MLQRTRFALASIPWWVWLTALAALLIRVVPIGYGLPYEFDPDEYLFVSVAGHMVEHGTYDPGWYGVPASTLIDVLAGLFATYGAFGTVVGAFDSIGDAVVSYRMDVSHFFLIGRFVTAITGALVVLMAYGLSRELRVSVLWSSVAALALAVSWPMVEYSSIVRMDMLLAVFIMATVFVMVRVLDRPSARSFVAAGVLLGLAVTSKYPGILAVVPILGANVTLTVEGRITPRRGLVWLAGAAAASLITAFVVAPFLFINFRDAIAYVLGEARDSQLGANGSGLLSNLWRYLTEAMPAGLGWVGAALGVVGSILMLVRRRPRIAALTFWGYALFISALSLWWLRWALPLVPLLAVAGAYLLSSAEGWIAERIDRRAMMGMRSVIVVLLIAPLVMPTATNVWYRFMNDDTRLLAIEWVHEHVPEGTAILTDAYTTQVSTDDYDVYITHMGELRRWSDISGMTRPSGFFGQLGTNWQGRDPDELIDEIKDAGIAYIVLARPWIDLYRAEQDAYPDELAVYERLLNEYPVVQEFGATDAPLGWHQIILDASAALPRQLERKPTSG
jgi:Dolichyl-phosphate-mannose-protein mannosyltransferase